MKYTIFLLLSLLGVALSATRPTISDQFYAEVRVVVNDNHRVIVGGGMLS